MITRRLQRRGLPARRAQHSLSSSPRRPPWRRSSACAGSKCGDGSSSYPRGPSPSQLRRPPTADVMDRRHEPPGPMGSPTARTPTASLRADSPTGLRPAAHGQHRLDRDRCPGTVTAAGWITIVFSALSAALFGFVAPRPVVARDQIDHRDGARPGVPRRRHRRRRGRGRDGRLHAVLVLWAIISIVLGVFVLRRSNVARILLVISSPWWRSVSCSASPAVLRDLADRCDRRDRDALRRRRGRLVQGSAAPTYPWRWPG